MAQLELCKSLFTTRWEEKINKNQQEFKKYMYEKCGKRKGSESNDICMRQVCDMR